MSLANVGRTLNGLVGGAGGASGTGFAAPQGADVQTGLGPGQIGTAYNGAQNSLASQQALLAALQQQNGFGQQNKVGGEQQTLANQLAGNNSVANQGTELRQQQYLNNALVANNGAANQGSAYQQTQGLANQLGNANGVGNQSAALASQMALARQQQATAAQYQGIANGTGPNPAMAALNQTTGQNVANQAALMAGQRGAGANVGLLARQAAQQGAATQQQAVGQGATMQAQQELNALSGLSGQQQAIGNTQQNVANIAQQQVGQTQAQQAALANQAATQVGQAQSGIQAAQQAASGMTAQQQAQQQAQAQQANVVAGQQIGGTTANTQAQQSEQGILQNALSAQNSANVSSQGNVNSGNAALAQTNMQGQQGILGGLTNAVGAGLKALFAEGGQVPAQHFDDGGDVAPVAAAPVVPAVAPVAAPGPQSSMGKFLQGWAGSMAGKPDDPNKPQDDEKIKTGPQALQQGFASLGKGIGSAAKGAFGPSSTPAGLDNSVGPDVGGADMAAMAAKGGAVKKDFREGGGVQASSPGQKAVKAGNSYDNDKIPAVLSEGEVVIPRSVMQGKDPARGAADFVAKVMAKRRAG